jgi:hypothetical protein
MNWLHGSMLGWSALALAPFLLHWLLRDRIRRIAFAGTRFLGAKEAVASSRKHWLEALLMLLRAALLLLLVVAFARPYWSSALGVHPMMVVLVDCSRSMLAGGRFARAQADASAAIDHAPAGEQVIVAGIGDGAAGGLQTASDAGDARRRIAELHIGGGKANLLTAIEQAATLCGSQPSSIHLFSALQSDGFPSAQRIAPLPESCRLVVHDEAHADDTPQASLQVSAEMEGGELTPGDGNLVVAARVTNRGPARQATVSMLSGDTKLDEHSIDLPQDGSCTVTLRGSLHEVGDIPVSVELGEVPVLLPEDNRFRLVASVVRQIHVAIVDGQPAADHAQDPAFFIAAALKAGSAGRYAIAIQKEIPPLTDVQALVLACPSSIAAADSARLAAFVAAGGGLLTVLGPGQDPERLNAGLAAIAPAQLRSWHTADVTLTTDPAGAALFSRIVGDHAEDFSLARFSGSADLKDAAGSTVLLRFSDQRPALLSDHHGQGVSMLMATALDRRVGDFPLRPLFLPLVHELVRALHAEGAGGANLHTGDDLALALSDHLSGPHGACPADAEGHLRATDPGFYHLDHDGGSRLIAVNGDASAASAVLLQADDVEHLVTQDSGVHASSHGLERTMAPDEVRQAEARLGLGRWCLVLVALLLVVELLVAQSVSRR